MSRVSDIKLKRTDTTHDLSQKAEKRYRQVGPDSITISTLWEIKQAEILKKTDITQINDFHILIHNVSFKNMESN